MTNVIRIKPEPPPGLSEHIRVLVGIVVVAGSILLAQSCEDERMKLNHSLYEVCVASGETPIKCSFKIAFGGNQ